MNEKCVLCGKALPRGREIVICAECERKHRLGATDEPAPRRHEQREAEEQTALFRWSEMCDKREELQLMFHVPNGGSRNRLEAANLKRQGVKAGVPVIFLPVARGGFHGLFVEMKAEGGRLSEKQEEWLADLHAQGYAVKVAYGWEEARKAIEAYLGMGAIV